MIYNEVKEARWWISRAVRLDKEGRAIGAERALWRGAQALVKAADLIRDEVEA